MNQFLSTASPKAAAPQSIAEVHGALSFIRPRNTKPVFHSSALTGGVRLESIQQRNGLIPNLYGVLAEAPIAVEAYETLANLLMR